MSSMNYLWKKDVKIDNVKEVVSSSIKIKPKWDLEGDAITITFKKANKAVVSLTPVSASPRFKEI